MLFLLVYRQDELQLESNSIASSSRIYSTQDPESTSLQSKYYKKYYINWHMFVVFAYPCASHLVISGF